MKWYRLQNSMCTDNELLEALSDCLRTQEEFPLPDIYIGT